jgi:exopolysaccharide production protein ExoY
MSLSEAISTTGSSRTAQPPLGRIAGWQRALDVVVALTGLLLFAPLMVLVAVMIRLQDGGPALFGHSRIGLGGGRFKVLKFRSMVQNGDVVLANHLRDNEEARAEWARDHKLRNDPRVTALGAFLRKSSLDELPQLFNVLMGEMSIVGPRPIVELEATRYGRYFHNYMAVPPGITGLWQISGRNDVSYRRRVAMDVVFSRHATPALYVKIVCMTVPAVLLRRGSY